MYTLQVGLVPVLDVCFYKASTTSPETRRLMKQCDSEAVLGHKTATGYLNSWLQYQGLWDENNGNLCLIQISVYPRSPILSSAVTRVPDTDRLCNCFVWRLRLWWSYSTRDCSLVFSCSLAATKPSWSYFWHGGAKVLLLLLYWPDD